MTDKEGNRMQDQTQKSSPLYSGGPSARQKNCVSWRKRVCTKPGEIGALVRRERICTSYLSRWRRARERGELRGSKAGQRDRKRLPGQSKRRS